MAHIEDLLRDALRQDTRPARVLAEALGVHEMTVVHFKRGAVGLRPENLEKLADLLGYEFRLVKVRDIPPHVHKTKGWRTRAVGAVRDEDEEEERMQQRRETWDRGPKAR